MYNVEYLIIVDPDKGTKTVDALKHLLQSNIDIVISSNGQEVSYKNEFIAKLNIIKGNVDLEGTTQAKTVYFDITLTCTSPREKDIKQFTELLKAIRVIINSILLDRSSMQILWNDISEHYAKKAYPQISHTENLMRKLITKFMHINVGNAWTDERVPDDVQKTLNVANKDTTYLHNVDFIRLKDILLSDRYAKDKDALLKKLKNSEQASFKREEIKSLVPTSNWEKYFSKQVNCSADELETLWSKLYDLRCQVAHNKSFSFDDLRHTKELVGKLDKILNDAISKLDAIHVDQDDAQDILEDAVTSVSKNKNVYTGRFIRQWRILQKATYAITSPLQGPLKENEKQRPRIFAKDVRLMLDKGIINSDQYETIKYFSRLRNQLVHSIDDAESPEVIKSDIENIQSINTHLESHLVE